MAEDLETVKRGLVAAERDVRVASARRIRDALTNEHDKVVSSAIDSKVPEDLVKILHDVAVDDLDAQIEALWCLVNLSGGSSSHTNSVVEAGSLPVVTAMLSSKDARVAELAAWVLGNVAGDGHATRDRVLREGALEPLLTVARNAALKLQRSRIEHAPSQPASRRGRDGSARHDRAMKRKKLDADSTSNECTLLRTAIWTVSNLCDHQPRPDLLLDDDAVDAVLDALSEALRTADAEVLGHACWALSHVCDGPSPHVGAVVEQDRGGLARRLVMLLKHPSWRVVKPALRTVGNIVCAEDDEDYTQIVIDRGAVSNLEHLVDHANREIQKEACWTLSNIAAGTVLQIQTVLDSGAIPKLVNLAGRMDDSSGAHHHHARGSEANLVDTFAKMSTRKKNQRKKKANRSSKSRKHDDRASATSTVSHSSGDSASSFEHPDPDVRIEACWVLLNATSCGSDAQIERIVREGCVDVLCGLLEDSSMAAMALEGLEKILTVAESVAQRDPSAVNKPTTAKGLDDAPTVALLNSKTSNDLSDVLKIGELQHTHRLGEIRKRAGAMWNLHFVTCGICKRSYAKSSDCTFHCSECKCVVCQECDCSRFHLSYQDELWASEETKEKNRASSKAKKKAKKKARDKKKKEQAASTTKKPEAAGSQAPPASDYVDFLMQKGSILELAKLMEREESVSIVVDSEE